jgi:thiamine biosynthesis protein ThiS
MTVNELLHTLDVAATAGAITVNGDVIKDREQVLQEGDRIRVLSLIAGG